MTTAAPRNPGFEPETHYDCPRCGQLVRVIYRQTVASVNPESNFSYNSGWTEVRFTGGSVIDSAGHRPSGYAYGTTCMLRIPPPLEEQRMAHFVSALWIDMLPYHLRRDQTKRLMSVDSAAFLAGPWCVAAPARESGEAPMILLAQSFVMHFVVQNGRLPTAGEIYQISDYAAHERLAQEFVDRISGEIGSV